MKNPLIWITKTGTIANLLVGNPISVKVQALDTTNNAYTVTYQLLHGSLPPGMSLASDGTISGTPSMAGFDITSQYEFILRATSSNNNIVDGSFIITLTNIINGDFAWITPAGDLGMIPDGEYYSLQFQADSASGSHITYSFISGELPAGMQLLASGYLTGVPTFLNAVLVDQSKTYRFTVRATNALGQILDRSFSVSVTNVYGPTIRPTTGLSTYLGTVFDGVYFTQQLSVQDLNPNVSIQWSVVEGALPNGVALSSKGLIFGYIEPLELIGAYGPAGFDGQSKIPVGTTAILSNSTISGSTLSVGTVQSGIIQLGMYLTGGNIIAGTTIVSSITTWQRGAAYNVGDLVLYNNSYYRALFNVAPNNDFNLTQWVSTAGNVNMWRIQTPGQVPQHIYDTTITATVLDAIQQQEYDLGPYDFNQLSQNLTYGFTIQAFDGANYDTQQYVLEVVSRGGWTADSTASVNDTYLTADSENAYIPVLRDTITTLPAGRSGSHYAYKFDGYDFQGDDVSYAIANTVGTFDAEPWDLAWDTETMNNQIDIIRTVYGNAGAWDYFDATAVGTTNLPGLNLDADNGWLYGNILPQTESVKNFQFGVVVSKTVGNVVYSSTPVFFTLPVLGDVNNVVEWISPDYLGSIDNGSVSELSVVARSMVGKELVYSMNDTLGVAVGLPQGLSLLPSGDISGRVSFEVFSLDMQDTTFDNASLTIDRTFKFTVKAETFDGSSSMLKTFTLRLNVINVEPYNNLYLHALPATDQRAIYKSIITNEDIFDPNLIYRPTDPWFGVQPDIKMLFLSGLSAESLSEYQSAMARNHWTKTYNFSDVKTAVVLDEFYKVKYEVVYIQITDPAENENNHGAPAVLNLASQLSNPYIDEAGISHTVLYPNSSENMAAQLITGIGYYDQSSLPPWMTSNQPEVTSVSQFRAPLGYTKAVVLAYTIPGASKLIAYRLRKEGITFNNINFTVDRYSLDNYYSTNFNLVNRKFIPSAEVTFDQLPKNNVGAIVANVNYAVKVAFDEINGRPVSYIIASGGFDGRTDFTSGQTLIFTKQENYTGATGPYDGWVNYRDSFFGDTISTELIEGYDQTSYDTFTLIPGYLEKAQGTAPINQRGGVWRITIVNGVVFLVFVQEVFLNQRIQITSGKSYASAVMYYNPITPLGQSVPYYTVANSSGVAISKPTTFNAGTTKFFQGKDQYYAPGSQDKYLKFPQYGVFK